MNKETAALAAWASKWTRVTDEQAETIAHKFGPETLHDGVHMVMWATGGYPVIAIRDEADVRALSETDPPTWDVPNPFGESGVVIELPGRPSMLNRGSPKSIHDGPGPVAGLTQEAANRLVANIYLAIAERPEGLSVTEHRRHPKTARKNGRKFFPGLDYVIGSSTPLHRRFHDSNPSGEGWTLSVRTIVRGHWRCQACGPRHSERKVIWIAPHWRGPEDAPVSIHTTLI